MKGQLIGSLLVAAIIVVVTILVVNANLGPPMSEAEPRRTSRGHCPWSSRR